MNKIHYFPELFFNVFFKYIYSLLGYILDEQYITVFMRRKTVKMKKESNKIDHCIILLHLTLTMKSEVVMRKLMFVTHQAKNNLYMADQAKTQCPSIY